MELPKENDLPPGAASPVPGDDDADDDADDHHPHDAAAAARATTGVSRRARQRHRKAALQRQAELQQIQDRAAARLLAARRTRAAALPVEPWLRPYAMRFGLAETPPCEIQCAPDCTDGALYLMVLLAWRINWSDLPPTQRVQLLRAWAALSPPERVFLLKPIAAVAEEPRPKPGQFVRVPWPTVVLDERHWATRMCSRDDVDMLEALMAVVDDDAQAHAEEEGGGGGGKTKQPRRAKAPPPPPPRDEPDAARWRLSPSSVAYGATELVGEMIVVGAVRCLSVWAAHHGWPEGGWASRVPPGALRLAAAGGHADMVDLLRYRGDVPWDADTPAWAAAGGHVAVLRSVVEVGECPVDDRTAALAAYGGHLACLEYLHQRSHKAPAPKLFSACAAAHAALGGQLACLEYLHAHGYPWDERTCTYAAERGHLDCLAYARAHGCPWRPDRCLQVAQDPAVRTFLGGAL